MRMTTYFVLAVLTLVVTPRLVSAADDESVGRPLLGEVRGLAISPNNTDARMRLHHEGWLEASGQLLSASAFPELYKMVGRAWTTSKADEGFYAIPDIHDQSLISSDNPFGVLGPGDLVTGGRVKKAWLHQAPISYWIFVGRDASQIETITSARR